MTENPYQPPATSCEPSDNRSLFQKFEDALPDAKWKLVLIGVVVAFALMFAFFATAYIVLETLPRAPMDDED
jgi:hypothetical protein